MSNKNKTTLTASIKPKDGAQLFVDWTLKNDTDDCVIFTGKGLKLIPKLISKSKTYKLFAHVKGEKGDSLVRIAAAKDMNVTPEKACDHDLPDRNVSASYDRYIFLVAPK